MSAYNTPIIRNPPRSWGWRGIREGLALSNKLSKDCVLTTLGMAFFWPAIHNQVLYPLILTFNKAGGTAFYFYLVYALIAIVTSLLLLASHLRKSRLLDSRPAVLAMGAIGTLGFAAMARFGFESAASTAAIGVGAAMYAAFVVMYFNFWSVRVIGNSTDVIKSIVTSYLIACLLQALRLVVGMHTAVFGLGCTVLTVTCAGLVPLTAIAVTVDESLRGLKGYPLRLIGLAFLLLCLLLAGIALTNPPMATNSYPPTTRAVMYAGCAAMCAVIIAISHKGSHTPYRAALLTLAFLAMTSIVCMLMTGFAVMPFDYVGNFPLIGCKIVIEMFLWALVLHNARHRRLPLAAMVCAYLVFVIFVPNLVSASTLHLGVFESAEDVVLLSTMSVSAMIVCVVLNLMLAALLFGDKGDGEDARAVDAGADATQAIDPLEEAFDAFQHDHELSNRQMDVVRLAYRNWTSKRIGEELFISEGTVKTHLKAIYKRADLHSKQDLIDAVDALRQTGQEKGTS